MMIAFANTPEELRTELLAHLEWLIKSAASDKAAARTVRDARYYKGREHALTNYRDFLRDLHIEAK